MFAETSLKLFELDYHHLCKKTQDVLKREREREMNHVFIAPLFSAFIECCNKTFQHVKYLSIVSELDVLFDNLY